MSTMLLFLNDSIMATNFYWVLIYCGRSFFKN